MELSKSRHRNPILMNTQYGCAETSYLTQDQLSVAAYYTKLKGLSDELASYTDSSTYTCASHNDRNKLMQLLMGLNESYSAVRGQILLTNPLSYVHQAYSFINQEEKQCTLEASRALLEPLILLPWLLKLDALIRIDPPITRIVTLTGQTQTFPRPPTMMTAALDLQGTDPIALIAPIMNGHHIDTCWKLHGYPEGHPRHKPKKNRGGPSSNHVSEGPTNDEI
ncbi:hypothetical protein L3X38_023885 [Prunus dulcis]|uniref:Uncharacterized protein n=1 Tax=Prunus dulcis TaxID=3755 RepID=A0AAD4VYX4_PRUDU|nr:hypothetical protein L3X38_023885 [Prunus dulcis]